MDGDNVAQSHAQVVTDDLVHAHFVLVAVLLGEDDANGVLALLALHAPRELANCAQSKQLDLAQADRSAEPCPDSLPACARDLY